MRAHRHFLAAPCFLLTIAAIALGGLGASSQEFVHWEEHPAGNVFSLTGVRGMVSLGGNIDISGEEIELREGSVLLSSDGLATLRASRFALLGLAGAFHATLQGDVLSVAAISSPVLILDGERRMLVPMGLQWRGTVSSLPSLDAGLGPWADARSAQSLPTHFQEDQLRRIALLPEPEETLPTSRMSLPLSFWKLSYLLPKAQERWGERWSDGVLGVLRQRIERGDEEGARALLGDPRFADALSSARGAQVLLSLLLRAPEGSNLESSILSMLQEGHESLWLLTALHPRYRALAWTLPHPAVSEESQAALLFALPQSDILPEALLPFTLERWAQAVSSLRDPVPFLEELVARLSPFIARLEEQGYPERARHLAQVLLFLAEPHDSSLSLEARDLLQRMETMDQVSLDPVDWEALQAPAEEEVVSGEEEKEVADAPQDFNAQEAEGRAYQLLREAGGLFTIETELHALSPDVVHASSVVFASPAGERLFDLDIDVARGVVREVSVDGEEFPYEVPLRSFAEWARK